MGVPHYEVLRRIEEIQTRQEGQIAQEKAQLQEIAASAFPGIPARRDELTVLIGAGLASAALGIMFEPQIALISFTIMGARQALGVAFDLATMHYSRRAQQELEQSIADRQRTLHGLTAYAEFTRQSYNARG